MCFQPGQAKNTYGTGNFLLLNTGTEIVRSSHGLISTVAYQFGHDPAAYALEGSIAVTGSAIQWLRDQLGVIGNAHESEALARSVPDTGGLYFVPAFSGLFAPHWRPDARGVIVGLSRFHNRAHLARAALEAICYQSKDVVLAMEQDSGITMDVMRVDGGVTVNDFAMQVQADVLGIPVSRPEVTETTALGAAYAAGLAVGFWSGTEELAANWVESMRWEPTWSKEQRDDNHLRWRKAIDRSLNWIDVSDPSTVNAPPRHSRPVADPTSQEQRVLSTATDLSPRQRTDAMRRLREEEFDVLVIGGGVVGAGVALDAATRGLSVALVEARDYASGTSSRSSKLVHGGLRYLEQLDFGLVTRSAQGAVPHPQQAVPTSRATSAVPLPLAAPRMGAPLRRQRHSALRRAGGPPRGAFAQAPHPHGPDDCSQPYARTRSSGRCATTTARSTTLGTP